MSQINEKSETKPATPQSLDARLCRCRLLALPVGVRALQDVFGTVHAPDLCTATGVEWNAAGKPLLPAGIERAPDKSCRCPPSNAAFSDAAVCPVHGNAATAAPESNSEFSRGVREGLERAAGLEKAARLLVGTYIRVTDPSWCGCCASHIGEGGGHRGDCEAASMLRALAAQEGREPQGRKRNPRPWCDATMDADELFYSCDRLPGHSGPHRDRDLAEWTDADHHYAQAEPPAGPPDSPSEKL